MNSKAWDPFDLRFLKEQIRSEVRKLNETDENWKWSVEAVNKKEARIRWGYLDSLDGGCFKLLIEDWSDADLDEQEGEVVVLRGVYSRYKEHSSKDFYNEFVRHAGLEFIEVPFEQAVCGAIRRIGYAAFTRF